MSKSLSNLLVSRLKEERGDTSVSKTAAGNFGVVQDAENAALASGSLLF